MGMMEMRFNKSKKYIHLNNEGIDFFVGVSPLLTDLYEILDYKDGFITLATNYGNEYIDLNELSEVLGFEVSDQISKLLINLTGIKLLEPVSIQNEVPKLSFKDLEMDENIPNVFTLRTNNGLIIYIKKDDHYRLVVSTVEPLEIPF